MTAVEPTPADQPEPSEFSEAASSPCFNFEDLASELDDLLDEIDGVLETNAEDFVKSYVQKGGQ